MILDTGDALCLWRNECALAPLCRHATVESGEYHQTYFAPTRYGEICPYYDPATDRGGDKEEK
jgi:hypothetical protein